MDSHDRLASLLLRWQDAYQQGQEMSAAELCRDCPELADALGHHIDFQKKLGRAAADDTTDPTDQPTADLPANASLDTAPLDELPPPLAALLKRQARGEPALLGRYRLLRLLGQGGMGAVVLAEDTVAGRQVALKFMKPGGGGARARFLREARAAASLRDDHVVPIFHVDEADGLPYLAMPFLEGESLEARLQRSGKAPLPPAEVVQVGREAALGLAAAHAKGLIHRDVKPANLWLERREGVPGFRTLVLDFGLARPLEGRPITEAGGVLGTPGYMAPEQADGLAVDARTDLFSLGCVLYRLATNRPAFAGKTVTALLRAVAEQQPPPVRQLNPDVPAPLANLITQLLAKEAAQRPASARAVADALESLRGAGAADTAIVLVKPVTERARRRPGRRVAVAAALLLVLGGVAVWALKRPAGGGTNPGPDPGKPSAGQKGWVDVLIWRGPDGAAEKLRLGDAGALPLYRDDKFRIEAQVAVPAYLYLFWIDTEGKALPLYPWQPGKWGTRNPAEEKPTRDISLPKTRANGYRVKEDREGMETLLLLARETVLPLDDAEVQQWFAGLPPQRPIQHKHAAVWFDNGRAVSDDPRRKRDYFDTEVGLDDPVLRLQDLLERRLQRQASFTSAVSFARLGARD